MSRRRVHTIWAILTSMMMASAGCHPQQPFYLHEDGDLSHYIDVATEIEYPDVCTTPLDEVTQAVPPLTLDNLKVCQYWDLTLEESIKTAMANAKVIRTLGGRFASSAFNNRTQVGEAPDGLTLAPDAARTVYDPAIVETTPFTGVEYALAAFDAQWNTNLFFQHNDRQQNVQPTFPITDFFRQVFTQETSTFNTQLSKTTAQGGTFTVRNNIIYDLNNNPTRQIPKDWNVNYELSFNQPLLAGAGAQFNRIAGPFNPFLNIVGGAQQSPSFDGVLLARINVDVSLADFEGGVRNLVSDVENAYWELSFAWRNLETSNTALASAKQTWKKTFLLYQVGTQGGEAAQEAQAREQYFQFKSTTQALLNELMRAENRLRWVMGLSTSDGRLIRPIDTPTVAKVEFDWCEITEEALARNLDLRRQKWQIKRRELELIAAQNLIMPRLDLTGTYRFQGLGDTLFGANRTPFQANIPLALTDSSALQTLATGQFQEWALGAQMSMPIGFRKELTTVRHFQLQLAKERAKLQDLELELSHQLADAVRQLKLNYQLTQTNFNRTLAAERQVEAVAAAFEAQTVTLDQLLEAQRRRAEAQAAFFRTLLDYQRAIINVHYRKGSLLEYNNVYLTEGPWPAKAKFDAHRRARARDAAYYVDYGFTRPAVMSQGAINQGTDGHGFTGRHADQTMPVQGVPTEAAPVEELPPPSENELPVPDAGPMEPAAMTMKPLPTVAAHEPAAEVEAEPMADGPSGFDWGSLGLAGDVRDASSGSASPGRASRSTGVSNRAAKGRAASAPKPLASATKSSTRDWITASASKIETDGAAETVQHQKWKPASANEPVQDQPSGPALGAAAGR
ncbi:MAG: TolC family protein [Pirellulales bacterium]